MSQDDLAGPPSPEKGRDTRHLFVLIAVLLVAFHPPALALVKDAARPPTPLYLYGVIVALYIAFVGIHWIGQKIIKERSSALAALVSNSIPLSVVVCPFIVVILADRTNELPFWLGDSSIVLVSGIVSLLCGVVLIASCELAIKKEGDGTLSPMEEINTRSLVVSGLYAYTRNPMIVGAVFMILGLALVAGSNRFLLFLPYFVVVKTLWFKYFEEPSMRRRFGDAYDRYTRHVGRWLPRLKAYEQASTS